MAISRDMTATEANVLNYIKNTQQTKCQLQQFNSEKIFNVISEQ